LSQYGLPVKDFMDIESLRAYCLSLPAATEGIQWDNDLLFRIGGKIFAVASLEITPTRLSFKCTPEIFDQLVEVEGIIPAPYMARNKWVMLERLDALDEADVKRLVKHSYDMIFAKLPKKTRETMIRES
jgi:predicted DNA-binding protein (MmcQ/YjbR family)